jgi:phenylpropionate dioxygenase-like ring-hydroxylating dioxygenase large terminal subunit
MTSHAFEALRLRDTALVDNWYVACLSRELGTKPIQRVIYDTPLVLYRDSQKQARAMKDRCLHRGTLLSEGRLEGDSLVCPYHGWRYSSDGVVEHIPSEGPQSRPKAKLCNTPFSVVEQDGCVWVWMGEGAPQTPNPPFRFPRFEDPSWEKYFMITDFDNEVTHLAENFMDVPHTVFVHAGWFRSPAARKVPIRVETCNAEVLVTYEQKQDSIGFSRWLVNPKNEPMFHTDHFIMPNITKVDYLFGDTSGFVIVSQITPVSTMKSRVYTAIIYRFPLFGKIMKPFFRFYTRQVIEQDVDIMANQGRSFRMQGEGKFVSTGADIVHISIERLRKMGASRDPDLGSFSSMQECEIWI